jgi:hypothetical protein
MVQLDFFEPPVVTAPRSPILGEKLENPKPTSAKVTSLQEWVQEKANIKLTTEKSYKYEKDDIVINNQKYKLSVSYTKEDEWTYEFDSSNTFVKTLVFRLKTHTKEDKNIVLKFRVGFSQASVWNNVWYKIKNQQISYIQKLDNNFWGKKFSNAGWNSIQNFEYFRYIFWWTQFHDDVMTVVREVIIDIHTKTRNDEFKQA